MESDYDRKFEEMKKYIPFLERMIKRLESTSTSSANPRQAQLDKIRSLRDLLLDKKKRMKMDNLLKCEQVLVNLYAKVEQRETLPGIKKASEPLFPSDASTETQNTDLNSARNKLKNVATKCTLPENDPDTLPEIAPASETEVICTPGSKEPALFQRRPHRNSRSPMRKSPARESTEKKSPQKNVPKRNYTRVLVSPEPSSRRWTSEETPSDKPLFSRRSPRKSPKKVSPQKKEKKKSSKFGKTKAKDLNITLNVPEESLDSLNTGDILSRIIKCPDNDVDIDTLRDLRTQILGELKQSGANDDISDLILKSYKKKKRTNKRNKEFEEGELSDSESEAIESIYGSLVVVDKDKNNKGQIATATTDKDKQARKIQISLVINSDKEEATDKKNDITEVIDFEMFDIENKNDENKSAKAPSRRENQKDKRGTAQSLDKQMAKQRNISTSKNKSEDLLTINVEDDDDLRTEDVTNNEGKDSDSSYIDISSSDTDCKSPKSKKVDESSDTTFKANFYNEHNEADKGNPTVKSIENDINDKNTSKIVPEIQTQEKSILSSHETSVLNETNVASENPPTSSDKLVNANANETKLTSKEKEVTDEESKMPEQNVEIPLLNTEPAVPTPPKKDVVSEIDILQALKNEILSGSIAIPGSDAATPLLHQPKVTKVASAQEIMTKKRISIEKYKEKSVKTTKTKSLFLKKTNISPSGDTLKKTSLKLTEQEQQRFNFPLPLESSDEDDKESTNYSVDDIYGDLAPKSPENNDEITTGSSTPIIIPVDPVKPTTVASADIDMRTLIPIVSPNALKSVPPPTGIFPQSTTRNMFSDSSSERRNEKQIEPRRAPLLDPRVRRDLKQPIGKDSPSAHGTPRHTGNLPSGTPNRNPNMTPNRNANMTPNSRSFEMTPSRQSFDLEDSSSRKHVYAPFPAFEPRREQQPINRDAPGPHWELNVEPISEERNTRWDSWKKSDLRDTGPSRKWDERDQRGRSSRDGGLDYHKSRYDTDKYNEKRDDYSYSKMDCPRTPVHSFGRSDCPTTPTPSFGRSECSTTPIHPFGRTDCPTTPSHPFGRSECPTTPIHPFGRSDCPLTPSHPFGRSDMPLTPNHPFGRSDSSNSYGRTEVPITPSHPFGRSDAPMTPSHPFGRSDAPVTPSHSFGRSEAPMTPSHPFGRPDLGVAPMTPNHPFGRSDYHQTSGPKVIKDPRLGRMEYEQKSRKYDDERDRGFYNDRRTSDLSNKTYNSSESYRHYRDQSVGRNDQNKFNREQTPGCEPSVGRSLTREYENDRLYTRDRSSGGSNEYRPETERRSRNYNDQPHLDYQRGQSVGRSGAADDRFQRSSSRGPSDNRIYPKQSNENTLSVKPKTGMSFTIDTSVNSTFQEFLNGKGLQVFDYSFDSRRQRAASVGRTLTRESSVSRNFRESSVGRTLSKLPKPSYSTAERDTSDYKRMVNFVRARSMGREILDKTERSFKEIKADLKSYRPNYTQKGENKNIQPDLKSYRPNCTQKGENKNIQPDLKSYRPNCTQKGENKNIQPDLKSYRPNYTQKGENKNIQPVKKSNYRDPCSRKDQHEKLNEKKSSLQNKNTVYSPRKNNRDPRMHRDTYFDNKSKSRYEDKKRNYGIVYSSDNIAKGTILGTGYGVKNYKIPKIKKPVVEKEPVKENTIVLKGDNKKEKSLDKPKSTETESKQNKEAKIFSNKVKSDVKKNKDVEKLATEKNLVNVNEVLTKTQQKLVNKPQENLKTRTTRRSKLIDTVESEEETISKTRKTKKAVINSDSEPETAEKLTEIEIPEKPKEIETKRKDESPVPQDDLLNCSFGMDDLDIFPENLSANPVLDNINALIAHLDNDIDTTKAEDFTNDLLLDNMFESIDSPEVNMEESLKDMSKVIINLDQTDMQRPENSSVNKEITELTPEIPVDDKKKDKVPNTVKQSIVTQDSQPHFESKVSENTDAVKDTSPRLKPSEKQPDNNSNAKNIQDNTVHNSNQLVKNANHHELSNVNNEAVVSTTEAEQISLKKTDELNEDRSSTPDSTLDTSPIMLNKSRDEGLPDSTNEKKEMHPDVSSTRDQNETSTKDAEVSSQRNTSVNSMENLLSMLQDRSKIKELLSMLAEAQSGDYEKMKKKLEKLSEIVSDDDDTNDGTKDESIEKNEHEKSNVSEMNIDVALKTITDVSLEIHTEALITKSDAIEPEADLNTSSEVQDTEPAETNEQTAKVKKPKKTPLKRGKKGKFKKLKNTLPGKRVTRSGTANKLLNKPKRQSRELKQLQESIKEMFMKDDILNATGIRMCRLSKLVDEKSTNHEEQSQSVDPKPVVVLEKFKDNLYAEKQETTLKKKPRSKPKLKIPPEAEEPVAQSKDTKTVTIPKYKPGPKSKTKNFKGDSDPYSFDDSVSEATTAQTSEHDNESETEDDSLSSLKSFGSSEVLAELKKKPKKKRRGKWQSGIIKKRRKKNESKPEEQLLDESALMPSNEIKIPDMNCFTDKSYCFLKNVTEYPCRLCEYNGPEIVKHYKTDHPHTEIPLSRMNVVVAREAVEQCEDVNFQAISTMPTEKYICRFCFEEFSKKHNVLEEFFWHVVSMHTGEYKRLCSECVNVTRCPFNLDIPPPPKELKGQLIGYICGKCNFAQISLENLKTHVIIRHNDEQTAVYTINLAVMSKKTIHSLMKRCNAQDKARVLRSLRSKTSAAEKSEPGDCNEDTYDVNDVKDLKIKSTKKGPMSKTPVQSKLSFESDDNMSETVSSKVKIKTEEDENDNQSDNTQFEAPDQNEPDMLSDTEQEQPSSDILDCPHFKISYANNGSKEYVCCINGIDNHYKTHLLISMKKHVQIKHSEIWDGYCSICKVIVMPQGGHRFKECFQHMLDKHMDNFPVFQHRETEILQQTGTVPGEERPTPELLQPIPERVSSPLTYINVRPLTDLMTSENKETAEALPKIQSVVSLGTTISESREEMTPELAVSVFKCPTTIEKTAPKPEETYKYEERQAEVMTKKHLAILESMLSEDKLVQIFKCAGRYCSFTTDSADAALLHASTHQRIGGENALLCTYCDYDCKGNAIELVMHVFKMHGRCSYVCGQCFYRAVANALVLAHIHRVHGGTAVKVLETATVTPVADDDSADMLPRDVAVQHYVCPELSKTCSFKTYTQGKFIEHLIRHAPPYLCHYCALETNHPSELLHHLKTHGFKMYQCTWCVEGGDNEADFLAHLSSRHPTRQPQAYLRIITNNQKGGGSKTMVLPLVKLNKSTVTSRLVTPQNISNNPAREAEKSLDMENLIAAMPTLTSNEITQEHTRTPTRVPSSQPSPQIPNEEATVVTNIVNQPRLVTPPPSTSAQEKNELLLSTPILKTEPIDESPAKNLCNPTIICLDSDEEDSRDANQIVADKQNVIETDKQNVIETDKQNVIEKYKQNVIETDKQNVIEKDKHNVIETDKQNVIETEKQNVIDLSDDDRTITSDPEKYKKFDSHELYKCYCQMIFKSFAGFKRHIFSCFYDKIYYFCGHCAFKTSNLEDFFNHYAIDHNATKGEQKPTYACGMCNRIDKALNTLRYHIKKEHGFTNLSVTSNPNGNYIVTGTASKCKPGPKRKLSGGPVSQSSPKRIRYGAQDLHKLSQKPILDELAYCSECEFSTKVRSNLVRHIQQHADDLLVPQTAPVNPVPHLETNEKHFDRMINLASSSLETPRAEKSTPSVTLFIPPEAATRYPKYVPERQRHTCGAKGCSYISVDEAMLKCHWETLHAGSNDFHCVHCPPYQYLDTSKPLTASRIIAHLKMHDIRLYACSSCTYYHYRKQVVEKHLAEVHKGAGQMLVVREESTGAPPTVGVPQVNNTAPTMDLKPWKCGVCAFKSMLRPEVIEHCFKIHNTKMQFKCPVCPFRTSTLENVTKHKTKSHPENNEDVFYFFYREGSIPDEKDGTPRWMKQRQKMGNPDAEVKTEEPESAQQNPLLASLLKPVLPATSTYNINLNIVKEEVVELHTDESMEALCKKFGAICDPNGLKFKCPLCKLLTEDKKEAMQSHLYEELKYRKWACSICCYKAFHKTGLNEHMVTEHRQNRAIEPIELDADAHVEKWVTNVLDYQAAIIETNKSNLAKQKIQVDKPSTPTPAKTVDKPSQPATESLSDKETENLIQAFGQFGAPNNANFCCPKCGYQTGDERMMKDHLEIELNKIRWRCSSCWENSQNYHEAQLHSKTCKSSRSGQASRPVEAIRDPAVRAAWLAAVIRTQKQSMKQAPELESESHMDDIITGPLENSLLVVRYEGVPTPTLEFESIGRRKRPAPTSTDTSSPDSDDERLIIDEPFGGESETPKKHEAPPKKCMYCPYATKYQQQLEYHILRHYNLKPMTCCYCEETCYYSTTDSHTIKAHPHLPKKFKKTLVPPGPPLVLELFSNTNKCRKRSSSSNEDLPKTSEAKTPTKEEKKDDGAKLICLVCEKAFSESETASHNHDKPTYFASKGQVVVKCCVCLSLFPNINLMQEHNKQSHPNTAINYAYFKINHNNREIHQCGHCSKRFKFFRDLKTHHNVVHSAQQLKYETRPYYPGAYDFECETESKGESSKTSENTSQQDMEPVRAAKRTARKSTTKLPVARKSTTKLPFFVLSDDDDSESEFSYYGDKPTSLDQFENVTTRMPIFNTIISLKKFNEILKINPVVRVKDCKKINE